jgi:hypothetical protein
MKRILEDRATDLRIGPDRFHNDNGWPALVKSASRAILRDPIDYPVRILILHADETAGVGIEAGWQLQCPRSESSHRHCKQLKGCDSNGNIDNRRITG